MAYSDNSRRYDRASGISVTVDEAKREVWLRQVGGIVFWALSILALFAVVGKSLDLYGGSNNGFVGRFYPYLRYYIELAQYHVPPLAAVWPYVPVFDLGDPLSWSNIWPATPYLGIWGGATLRRTGVELAEDVRTAEKAIRQEQLQESLRPGPRRSAAEIRLLIDIPRPSFWHALVRTWLAPLVVAILAGLVLYLFGWN
jgi:hypothetical protein